MHAIAALTAEYGALLIEVLGIGIIALLSLLALLQGLVQWAKGGEQREGSFREMRLRLGHGILLGLEFLVAADIIRTVAVEFTWESVGILAIIVLIRTFLSFTLEVELTGRWPWQQAAYK